MREQRLSRFSCITEPVRHARHERYQRSLEGILKQHRKIELPASPLANLRNNRKRSLPVVEEHVVDEIGFCKNSFSAGTCCERDTCIRQHSPKSAEGGDRHKRV